MERANVAIVVVAYDRRRATALLIEWTPQRLLDEARGGTFAKLGDQRARELEHVALAWVQRALGELPLRDALLIDPTRGGVAWTGLCDWLATERCVLPAHDVPPSIRALCAGGALPQGTADHVGTPSQPCLAHLLAACDAGLVMTAWTAPGPPRYPLPARLDLLLPPLPSPLPAEQPRFEQPTGTRRILATVVACLGIGLVGLPLLVGQTPTDPAGLPLALITLALLVGIRAGPAGYLGSLCIWLVANLPGFHHGSLLALWPALPLLVVGLLLLLLDAHVRALWRWIRSRIV